MPNVDAPSGLRPIRYRSGLPYAGGANKYYVPATDATDLFIGDPVILAGSADADGVATVTRATAGAGNYITGVVVGVDQIEGVASPSLARTYRPASTAMYVWVADDPELIFEIQEDSVGGALAATSVGLNASVIIAAGSTVTGRSGTELDSSTAATTNTLALQVLRLARRPDNEIGDQAKWEVRINLHTYRNLTGV
jgi:hypothetical protein